jgi:hypothetical protein
MAKHSAAVVKAENECPAERPSTRINAFLAKTMPLGGSCFCGTEGFHRGRKLIEELALHFQVQIALPRWNHGQCADVLCYVHCCQPVPGACFCNDQLGEAISITCGFHEVLEFVENQLRRPATRAAKEAREAANG